SAIGVRIAQRCAVLAPADVAPVMEQLGIWWAVAGGWAIDLWLGRVTRGHHDGEFSGRRGDQRVLHDALPGTGGLSGPAPTPTPRPVAAVAPDPRDRAARVPDQGES